MSKYRVKPETGKLIEHEQVCISCGKQDTYIQHIGITPRPRPNTTPNRNKANKLSCFFGSHQFYFKDEVEDLRGEL